jgi:hypothetical protein
MANAIPVERGCGTREKDGVIKRFRVARYGNRIYGGMNKNTTVYIYALVDPRTDTVRYIGKSVEPEQRFYSHLWAAKKTEKQFRVLRWIRTLLSQSVEPVMWIIEETTPELWEERERYWISHYGGFENLTNLTEGGNGVLIPTRSEEWKRKIGDAHRGKTISSEMREKLRASSTKYTTHCGKGHEFTPENTGVDKKKGTRICRECARLVLEKRRRDRGIKPRKEYEAEREPALYCKRGHLLSGDNLRILERKRETGETYQERICRTCVRLRNSESKKRSKRRKGVFVNE